MDCMYKNCNVSGEDRMVSCWLCLGSQHLRWSGLKPRDADALADNSTNMQWTCLNCKVIGIEFYNFFKSYKTEFDGIKKEFSSLQGRLTKYGELFSKYTNLDSFAASPKPKRKRTKTTTPPIVSENIRATTSKEAISLQVPNENSISNYIGNPSVSPLATPTLSNSKILPIVPNLTTAKPPELISLTPSTSKSTENPLINPFTTITPKPLKVITPRKTIFASRFQLIQL